MSEKKLITLLLGIMLVCFQTALAQSPEGGSLTETERRQQADDEMEKARELLKQGYFDSAVVKYQDAFKIAPRYPAPYEELGKLMLEKRNFAYAIEMYSKLVELEPRNAGYHRVLFDLADAYEASNLAVNSGEVLVSLGEADAETLKKMVSLYERLDRPYDQAKTMELYAQKSDADAEYWNSIATVYLQQDKPKDAERAINVALAKDPGNAKYRNTLARVYLAQNQTGKAEEIFSALSAESPEDEGLKDELAQLYVQQGDEYLTNGRGNTALEYYDKAEAAGITETEEGVTGVGVYEGTVNTTNQVFNNNGSLPGSGVGTYRRGASGFTSLGSTLAERRESAELLLRPQYIFDADFGNQDNNSYTLLNNVVRVPVRGTELDLRVRHSYRDVSSFAGSASREYLFAGFNYNFNKNFSTQAYVGTNGLYDVSALYEGDRVRGGGLVQRDVWSFTPTALGNDLYFNRQSLFGGVSLGERLSIDGNVDFFQFNDGIDQTIFSIGPSYQLLFEPGVQELQASYVYSGQSNSRELDPIVRFSPTGLTANSVGLDYNRVINDWWRLRAGYFYTWVNDGSSGSTWTAGTDFQLWKGAWLGLLYQNGSFGQGAIQPNLSGVRSQNDNLNVNFGVTF